MKEKIKVNSETMDYVQCLYFEVMGLELVLKNIMTNSKINKNYEFDKEMLDHYIDEVKKISSKFNLIKNEVIVTHIPDWINKNVIFDFINCEIYLDENSNKNHTCGGCNVK